jgi:hypothetical protein
LAEVPVRTEWAAIMPSAGIRTLISRRPFLPVPRFKFAMPQAR